MTIIFKINWRKKTVLTSCSVLVTVGDRVAVVVSDSCDVVAHCGIIVDSLGRSVIFGDTAIDIVVVGGDFFVTHGVIDNGVVGDICDVINDNNFQSKLKKK